MSDDVTPDESRDDERDREFEEASRRRGDQQVLWVDAQIRDAMARGEFDNLPGAGKPIEGLDGTYDPEWWVKGLIKRERLSGLGPPAILLRTEDTQLDDRLDAQSAESEVRRIVEDFNARVRRARMQLQGGPPVITKTRDVDGEVELWRRRRNERLEALRHQRRAVHDADRSAPGSGPGQPKARPRRPWWRLRRRA